MKYNIKDLELSKEAGLYSKSVAIRLKLMEHNIGLTERDKWYKAYEDIVNEIDYDNMSYGEQEDINKLTERIDYKAELEYYGKRLF